MSTAALETHDLSGERQALAAAKRAAKKIRTAAQVAAFNGWTLAAVALVNAPLVLWSSTNVWTTLGLAIAAFNEFHGRRRLLQFDPAAARFLGLNQLVLMLAIVGYSTWSLHFGLAGENSFAAQLESQPELQEAIGSVEDFQQLYDVALVAIYGTVIVASMLFQGLNAYYYFSRRKHIEAYVEATPDWALDVLRE